ncbi:MAG TPA: hypothetical protein VFL36_18310 [Myxococcales bacterium]|nr:hypothetical protein [Myxococcales bacterium]
MRPLALLLILAPSLALADEVDLTRGRFRDDTSRPPRVVIRVEGGNEFAPFGELGGSLSFMTDPHDELEIGAGGGFPGLQLGFAARHLFGEGGQYLAAELFLAGNTRVNRGRDENARLINLQGANAESSLWTGIGFGYEMRQDFYSLAITGNIVFTSTSLTPHWSLHGGLGFGF